MQGHPRNRLRLTIWRKVDGQMGRQRTLPFAGSWCPYPARRQVRQQNWIKSFRSQSRLDFTISQKVSSAGNREGKGGVRLWILLRFHCSPLARHRWRTRQCPHSYESFQSKSPARPRWYWGTEHPLSLSDKGEGVPEGAMGGCVLEGPRCACEPLPGHCWWLLRAGAGRKAGFRNVV